jgi:hypothetical protein
LSFPELLTFIRVRQEKELENRRWEAKVAINNSIISMSLLSGKKPDFEELFPGLFEKQQFIQEDNKNTDYKDFIINTFGIDKRGGDNNG